VKLAQLFGWRMDYIESLSEEQIAQIFGVLEGKERANKK